MTLCDVCREPLDPDLAHYPHGDGCARRLGADDCTCSAMTHPGCCPECVPVQCDGQLSIADLAAERVGMFLEVDEPKVVA